MSSPILSQALAESLRPPKRLKPSEWAERYFKLTNAAEAGKYRGNRTPYVAGIIDTLVDPYVEEVVWVSGTQIAKTTAQEIFLAYAIDNDPGPALIVKPSEAACEEFVKERIRPMLEAVLPEHLSPRPHDNTLSSIRLDSMSLYFGWAGSPQSLASRPCRYVLPDEVDKYPPFAGREADPISLAKERTATYLHRKRIFLASTPTTREGAIWRAFEGCGDKRYFHVPCPTCGTYQRLTWPQVKWERLEIPDKVRRADEVEKRRLAWYECSNPDCRAKIEEHHKTKMLERGIWAGGQQSIDKAGAASGDRPISKRVGFHLSSLYSPWRTLWEMAAEFIRADGDVAATMNFRNSRLAEPFEIQISRREPSKIKAKADHAANTLGKAGEPRVVPNWAVLVIATADVQKDHAYWQVDAWGYEQRSKRVMIGVASSLEEVYRNVFSPDLAFVSEQGGTVHVSKLIIDSGYRKDEVTEFARRDPARVEIAKGLSTYFGPIAEAKVEKASGVVVWNINTKQSKDTLDRLIADPDEDRWQVYAGIGDEFCSQLASEHKIIDPQTKQQLWKQKTSGAANHWWDCSAMSCAVATALGAAATKPTESPPQAEPDTGSTRSSWVSNYQGRY